MRSPIKSNQIDMLHGRLLGKLVLFALPLALSSILQQLFNAVDIAVLGQFATSQDQAAVGCTSAVINMFLNLFLGISVGANVVIATYIGQRDKEKVQASVHTAMLIALISGFVMMLGRERPWQYPAKFPISSEAPTLGELSSEARLRG